MRFLVIGGVALAFLAGSHVCAEEAALRSALETVPAPDDADVIERQTLRSRLRWATTVGSAAMPSSASQPDDDEPPTIFPTFHDEPDTTPEPKRWSSFLPLYGDAVREQGFDLPLPFGFSMNYVHLERDIDVDDISLRINDGPKRSVKKFLQVGADSSVDVAIGRVDAWILPFLDVYVYGGWQWNQSGVNVDVSVPTGPILPDIEFSVKSDGELNGPIYGIGTALAGGYEEWFMTATLDFAFAEFDEFDSRFEGRVFGLRTGWNGEVFDVPLRLWTGLSYYDTATTIEGNVNVPSVGKVRFEVDQGPENPWNTLIGVNMGMGERFDVMLEYGFNFRDVKMIALGATVRF